MADTNGSKKRKLSYEDDNDEELATEEQKIEKFYALIRSMREALDRLIMINGAAGPAKINIHDYDHDHDQYSQLIKYFNNVNERKKLMNSTAASAEEEEKKNSIDKINGEVLFKVPNSLGTSSSSPSPSVISDQKEDRQMMSSTNDGLDLTLSL